MVQLVGILNVTPDSFSDGGKFLAPHTAIKQAQSLFVEGASIVDIGAESTRPNAIALTDDEEWQRLEPILKVLIVDYPGKISLDTYHPKTAERALRIGPVIINDVTGMNNPRMIHVVAKLKPTVIISHLPNMDIQKAHLLTPVSTEEEVKQALLSKVKELERKGLRREQIILDPGIGFGKTMELNKQLLKFAQQVSNFKVMIGHSRKRFLGANRMELQSNLKAAEVAVASGAAYLRVHDVSGHSQLLKQF